MKCDNCKSQVPESDIYCATGEYTWYLCHDCYMADLEEFKSLQQYQNSPQV